MKIRIYTKMSPDNINLFVPIVYGNFIHLKYHPNLLHNPTEIKKLLNDKTFLGIFIFDDNKKILGYLIGKTMILNDGRKVFYISYIYVSKKFRNKKLGSKMLDIVHERKRNHDAIMLTCDTTDKLVLNFYLKRGYMLDFALRRYSKYDVLSKEIF